MKKVYVVLLLLVSVFLIGNAKVASAVTSADECDSYQCTGKFACEGPGKELINEAGTQIREECVVLCIDEGKASLSFDGAYCDLGGRSLFGSNRNFVGSCGIGSMMDGDLGCAVDLRGISMTVDLYFEDCMSQLRCVKSAESCITVFTSLDK